VDYVKGILGDWRKSKAALIRWGFARFGGAKEEADPSASLGMTA
jgi:hypothetical protein